MQLELVTIGDELLLGYTIDTNAAYIARELSSLGVSITRRATVGDDHEAIQDAVRSALARTGAVITTGGLGPTADDRSKPAIAELFGTTMRFDENILSALEARWRKRFDTDLPATNRQQALVPDGATILANRHGSAPGIMLEREGLGWVIMLPGVPREMRGMITDTVVPMLQTRVGTNPTVIISRTLRTANIAESALANRLGELARGIDDMPLAFLPGNEGVDLRLTSRGERAVDAERALDAAAAAIRERVGRFVYGEGDDDLAALMLAECRSRSLTVAVAESCTGGMLGMRLTAVPGSSDTFMGGIIAYDNAVKVRDLGVDSGLLQQHGAVSEAVARAMAEGVRARMHTSIGIGITGIAGPGGGTDEKPVGTVWVAVDLDGATHAVRAVLPGDRHEIRARAAQLALDQLRKALANDTSGPGWVARG